MGDPRVGSASFCETGEGGFRWRVYKEGTLDLDLKSEEDGDRRRRATCQVSIAAADDRCWQLATGLGCGHPSR